MYAISCSMSIYRKAGIQNKEAGTLWVGIILMLTAVQAFGQDSIVPPAARSHGEITSTAVIDFFTTFAGMHVINGQTSNENNSVYLYYNFSVNNKLKSFKFSRVFANRRSNFSSLDAIFSNKVRTSGTVNSSASI